jgi:hypothetical protein
MNIFLEILLTLPFFKAVILFIMFTKILIRGVYFLLLLTTLTPLIFQKKLFYSYDSEKGLFFRLILEIMFGLWLILILKEPIFRPKKSPINLALGFISIVLIIVDLLGVDWYLSIFSNFERMAGLIMYLSVFAFCLVASSIINSPKRWLLVGISLSTVAFIVATKGIIQFYRSDEVVVANERIVSTIGNANQLASYLILGFFVVGLLISEWILPLKKNEVFLIHIFINNFFHLHIHVCLLSIQNLYPRSFDRFNFRYRIDANFNVFQDLSNQNKSPNRKYFSNSFTNNQWIILFQKYLFCSTELCPQ